MADVEIFALFTQVDRAQAHREQSPTQLLENALHCFTRRQLAAALLAAAAAILRAPLLTGAAQAGHDRLQLPFAGG
ncbi:hypothetical protein D3C78_1842730 [compost metagenome]